ncbi:MAG: C39 family peptidase [Anaerolineae bacterium]
MSQRPSRRRSAPAAIWLLLGLMAITALACAGSGFLTFQQSQQIEALQAELEATNKERQDLDAQLAALQGTLADLGNRLATLEGHDLDRQLASLQAATETASSPQEIAGLKASLVEIQARLGHSQTVWDDLVARVELLESEAERGTQTPPSEVHLSVARQRQSHNLSCESSAASMVAGYHGIPLSEAEVLAALPLSDNPYLGFRGNVDGPTGGIEDYGVYAGPILDILTNRGLQAWPVEGGLDGIKGALARGNPVIAWITYDCWPSTPTSQMIGDQEVILVPYQHVVVVTGYSDSGVWANDPLDGQEDFYTTADFERAMGYFGDMAIEVASP